MGMKQNILVTFGSAYDMVTEEGDRLTGCSVQFFLWGDRGEGFEVMKDNSDGEAIGHKVMKGTIPYEDRAKLLAVPGIYEGDFDLTADRNLKPVLKLKTVDYVQQISFSAVPVDAFGDPRPEKLEEPQPDTNVKKK